jgi:hypothetical protein
LCTLWHFPFCDLIQIRVWLIDYFVFFYFWIYFLNLLYNISPLKNPFIHHNPFIHSKIHSFIQKSIHSFKNPFIHSKIHSFKNSFIQKSIHSSFIPTPNAHHSYLHNWTTWFRLLKQ